MAMINRGIKTICCYAHEDEHLLKQLKTHLKSLERSGLIEVWHDRDIRAGKVWEQEIKNHLNVAQIILLLISPDFISSDYCYSVEMRQAVERYEQNEVKLIPIIIRPTLWQKIPIGDITLGDLQALPRDAKPVIEWKRRDQAWINVVSEIERVAKEFIEEDPPVESLQSTRTSTSASQQPDETQKTMLPDSKKRFLFLSTRRRLLAALGGGMVLLSATSIVEFLQRQHTTNSNTQPRQRTPIPTETAIPGSFQFMNDLYEQSGLGIHALAWSPDGRKMAVAYENNMADIWNTVTRQILYRYEKHTGAIEDISWSPHGNYIVTGSADGTVHIWDETGTTTQIYTGHKEIDKSVGHPWVNGAKWSPEGTWILSCDQTSNPEASATVQIWNPQNGQTQVTYREHKNGVYSANWSPDSNYIASVGYDGALHIWEATSGKTLAAISSPSPRILYGVAWSHDSKYVIFGGDDYTIWLIDRSGYQLLKIYSLLSKTGRGVRSIAFSPKGNFYAVGTDGQGVFLFQNEVNSLIYRYTLQDVPGDIVTLGWSPVQQVIAMGNVSGTNSQSVGLWKTLLDY